MLAKIFKLIFFLIIASSILVATVILFQIDDYMKKAIEYRGALMMQVPIGIGKVDVDIIGGYLEAYNVVLYNPKSFKTPYFVRAEKMTVKINLPSIFTSKMLIGNVTFDSLTMNVETNKNGNNYFLIVTSVKDYNKLERQNDLASPRTSLRKIIKRTVQIDKVSINNLELHTKTGVIEARTNIEQTQVVDIGKNEEMSFGYALESFLEQLYKETIRESMKKADVDVTNTIKNVKNNLKKTLKKTVDELNEALE